MMFQTLANSGLGKQIRVYLERLVSEYADVRNMDGDLEVNKKAVGMLQGVVEEVTNHLKVFSGERVEGEDSYR